MKELRAFWLSLQMIQRLLEGLVVLRLQKDSDRLREWAKKWQMEYNVGKCGVMHFCKKNRGMDDFLNGEKIQKSEVQRDMGVLVQNSLK
eukprot:g15927.t1